MRVNSLLLHSIHLLIKKQIRESIVNAINNWMLDIKIRKVRSEFVFFSGFCFVTWSQTTRHAINLEHREVKSFLRGARLLKLCPIVVNYVQHIFPGG